MKKTIKFILLIAIIIGSFSCGKPTLEPADGPKLKIGDVYHGGAVFYLESNRQHGLAALYPNYSHQTAQWSTFSSLIGANKDTLYSGLSNTDLIVSFLGSGTYAARKCYDKVSYDYNDWYLPSKYELNLLRLQSENLPSAFKLKEGVYYWSSTESSSTQAWRQYISATTLNQVTATKTQTNYVIAIRKF